MNSKIKNIILFTVIAVVLIFVYEFFLKPNGEEANLSSTTVNNTLPNVSDTINQNSSIAQDFLSVLLSVKSIRLNDSIFSDNAFANLHDSTIVLSPPRPEDEGRPNPFAPLGKDVSQAPVDTTNQNSTSDSIQSDQPPVEDIVPPVTCQAPKVLDTKTNTCVTPKTKKS